MRVLVENREERNGKNESLKPKISPAPRRSLRNSSRIWAAAPSPMSSRCSRKKCSVWFSADRQISSPVSNCSRWSRADGTPIMLTDSKDAAIANAWEHQLETVSVTEPKLAANNRQCPARPGIAVPAEGSAQPPTIAAAIPADAAASAALRRSGRAGSGLLSSRRICEIDGGRTARGAAIA